MQNRQKSGWATGLCPVALAILPSRKQETIEIGFPVGFVGAAESKAALSENPRGVPFVTLQGRRGGSAMAGAAVNAIAAGASR